MNNIFKDKNVLVTGGTGSIGREVVHHLVRREPKVVRILDIDEAREFELREELKNHHKVRFLIGNVYDKERLYRAIDGIDIVFHLAALKHVFSGEYNAFEAVKTNVIGTQNIIDVAIEEEVERVIFTGTDKAVNPRNVMGATKLLGERLITAANYYKGSRATIFSSVRFGNVVASRGSVIPLFKNQIQAGGPVTLTSSSMTRFVMSSSQAVDLLFKATEMAHGGEIFILKMMALKVNDLMQVMVNELAPRYGYAPANIETEVVGARPGEKMHEELMDKDEAERALETPDMFIVLPEMQELLSCLDPSLYPEAKPAKLMSYSSKSVRALTKRQVRDLLYKENIL